MHLLNDEMPNSVPEDALRAADERKRCRYCTCGTFTVTFQKKVCKEGPPGASEDNPFREWRV